MQVFNQREAQFEALIGKVVESVEKAGKLSIFNLGHGEKHYVQGYTIDLEEVNCPFVVKDIFEHQTEILIVGQSQINGEQVHIAAVR